MSENNNTSCGLGAVYWLFAVIYTFMVWGFWWGVLNIFLPICPMIDLVKYIISFKN